MIEAKETEDLLTYGEALVSTLEDHNEDGEITMRETISTVITTSPEAIAAIVGSDKIKDEIKAMSPEQKEEALVEAVDILQRLVGLFWDADKVKINVED